MRKIITIVFVSLIPFLWSCNHDTKNDFELPTTKEYNEIICEILKQDTTFSKPEEKISISSYLLKNRIRLYLSADSSAIPYMPLDPNISIWTLMLYHLTNPVDFKYDSLYLSRQNQLENNVIVEEKCADFLFFSENEVSKKKRTPILQSDLVYCAHIKL